MHPPWSIKNFSHGVNGRRNTLYTHDAYAFFCPSVRSLNGQLLCQHRDTSLFRTVPQHPNDDAVLHVVSFAMRHGASSLVSALLRDVRPYVTMLAMDVATALDWAPIVAAGCLLGGAVLAALNLWNRR